jgi:hypothetical protein
MVYFASLVHEPCLRAAFFDLCLSLSLRFIAMLFVLPQSYFVKIMVSKDKGFYLGFIDGLFCFSSCLSSHSFHLSVREHISP